LTLVVAEVLSNSQTSQGNTGTSSWRLVHLTEHKGNLRLAVELDNLGLLHLVVQVISLTRSLSDTGEHGVTTVCFGNVVLRLSVSRLSLPFAIFPS
jgi:hypothetical protein